MKYIVLLIIVMIMQVFAKESLWRNSKNQMIYQKDKNKIYWISNSHDAYLILQDALDHHFIDEKENQHTHNWYFAKSTDQLKLKNCPTVDHDETFFLENKLLDAIKPRLKYHSFPKVDVPIVFAAIRFDLNARGPHQNVQDRYMMIFRNYFDTTKDQNRKVDVYIQDILNHEENETQGLLFFKYLAIQNHANHFTLQNNESIELLNNEKGTYTSGSMQFDVLIYPFFYAQNICNELLDSSSCGFIPDEYKSLKYLNTTEGLLQIAKALGVKDQNPTINLPCPLIRGLSQ